ncbi:m-AAA protease-interacting protein 1, mitochondrial [Parasteatoda tepidariorum]|uniref:m-AAA protease-interacting protein 1, mitochondrial n=1 Tax=Parasteatoda tepidariorum TaxID=114398 RepID=UPI00077FD812|nr:m-AAA protease-interacting protein 1, mitochondrial [Parasteatoda tepidariorum]
MNRQWLRALAYLRKRKINGNLIAPVCKISLAETNNFHFRSLTLFQTFNHIKFSPAVWLNHYMQTRNNSNESNDNDKKPKKKPTTLMNFVPIMRPQFFLTIKNWIFTKFIIQPYLDGDFTLKDFTNGAKQALSIASSFLSQGDFQSLQGLVADDAISEIKKNFCSLNVKERQDLLVKITDILFAFPFQIGIIFDDDNQKRFAEITVVYHCLNDFEEMKAQGKMFDEKSKEDIKICNYRFIREYTKGVKSDWTINRLGHFKLSHFED